MISCTASANVVNGSSSPPHCTFFLEGKTPLAVGSVGGNATGARVHSVLFWITFRLRAFFVVSCLFGHKTTQCNGDTWNGNRVTSGRRSWRHLCSAILMMGVAAAWIATAPLCRVPHTSQMPDLLFSESTAHHSQSTAGARRCVIQHTTDPRTNGP